MNDKINDENLKGFDINNGMDDFIASYGGSSSSKSIDSDDPDIKALMMAFQYVASSITNVAEIRHDDAYQLIARHILGYLVLSKPCCTLVRVDNTSEASITLKRGLVIEGENLISPRGDPIQFTPSYFKAILPMRISRCYQENKGFFSQIVLEIDKTPKLKLPKNFVFHLATGQLKSYDLFSSLFMARSITFEIKGHTIELNADNMTPHGLSAKQALFEHENVDLDDVAVLLDYFLLPEKLLAYQIALTEEITSLSIGESSLRIIFNVPITSGMNDFPEPILEGVAVNVVPAVNLFWKSSVPVKITHRNRILPISISNQNKDVFVHEVIGVWGVDKENKRRKYQDVLNYFFSEDEPSDSVAYNVRQAVGKEQTSVALELVFGRNVKLKEKEALLVRMLCSNGAIANRVKEGDLTKIESIDEASVNVFNILQSSVYVPAISEDDRTKLIGVDFRIRREKLEDIKQLKQLLIYVAILAGKSAEWVSGMIINMRMEEGVHLDGKQVLYGQEIHLEINSAQFDQHKGSIFVFGLVLSQLFASYAPVNFYSRLSLFSKDLSPNRPLFVYPPIVDDGRFLRRSINVSLG